MQEIVNLKTEYLDDRECITLLSSVDLVIQPYQETAESASGATRFALAAGTPVMVSPLPIFDELDGVVWRSNGMTPPELAGGILDALKAISNRSASHRRMREAALAWQTTHDIRLQGNRLMRIGHVAESTTSAAVRA